MPRTTLQAWQAWHDTLDICPDVAQFFQRGSGLAFLHRLVLAFHLVCVEVGACGIRLVCLFLTLTGLDRFVAASYGAQQQVNRQVEDAIVAYRQAESDRLAKDMPRKAITLTQDETFTGGLCLVGSEPVSNYIILEQLAQARDRATWNALMAPALASLNCADTEPPARDTGHPPSKETAHLAHVQQELAAAHCEHERLAQQREQVAQCIRAIGHAYHFVDLTRGVWRNGQLIVNAVQEQMTQIRAIAEHEKLSQTCLDRMKKAERVAPKMRATIELVSGYVRQQIAQLDLTPPIAFAMHAKLMPSSYLERVAQTRTVGEGEPLRELAQRLRAPLFEPGGVLSQLSAEAQDQLPQQAKTFAEVFQRSSSNVEGRNGYLSLRNHQLRGLALPRKRECLTAMHNFFLTRPDGTTAAERFFGQKLRSMFAAILASVELSPAPLSPPRRP